jgi:hypothetical protein
MRKNFILEDDLFKIFEGEYTNFLENPFINSDKNNLNSWSFIHRQIQEYFVAKALVGKKTLVVQEVISIPNTKIIHPSLFNTVTFLINLLPKNSEEFTGLLNWIKENQPELLFNADSDRIGNDLRVTIFQPYFKKECIDKTLWINTNKSYTVEEIAAFANCDANAEYLLNIIKAPQNNIRARISAINILEHFTFPVAKQFVLKEELLQLLKNANLELQIKAEIIDLINLQKICETDQEYLTQIFILFQDESNKELNRALLSLLDSQKDIDLHFDYIKREFLWDNGIIERETIDKVHRGNNWTLQSLILKLTNPENFIDIIYYHFSEEYNIQLNDDFANEISTKLIEFIGNDKNIAIDFFAKFNPKTKFHKHDNLLRNIILKSNSQIEVFKFIFNANEFSEVYYFLAQIAHLESIELVIQKYTTDEITENLESFRNVIGNTNSLELAEVFNNKMQVAGFNFIGKFFNSAEVAKLEEIHSKKPQDNFDVLFNQDELLSKIEKLFTSNSGVIDSKKIHEIEIEWYKKKGHWNTIIDNEIALTRFLIMKYRKQLDFNTIKTLLNDSDSLFEYIRIVIERSESYRNKIQITKNQKNVIINWCKVASDRIKFDNVIKLHNTQSFSKLPDYETLKLIQFYQSKLDFKLPKVFLLNTLEFYGMENSEDDASLVELFNKIEDEKAFNEQITNNIKNKQLFSITLNKHVYYAIENNLTATFNIIREYFKDDNIIYLSEGIFEKYISHSKDFSLLKECSINTHSRICWSALKILVDQNIDNLFCINKSLEYLSKKESNLFASEALGILFRLNRIEAIEYLYEFFVEKTSIHLTVNQFGNYSVENYDLIDKLFREICFDDSDSFRFMSNRAIFSNYIYNLSKKEESYLKVQEILKGIGNDKNITDSGLFYINLELDNSTNSYINSQSIPLDFEDALKKAKEIVT